MAYKDLPQTAQIVRKCSSCLSASAVVWPACLFSPFLVQPLVLLGLSPIAENASPPVQAAKGEDEVRPWGTDVLQAYMDKQLGKECVLFTPPDPFVLCSLQSFPFIVQSLHTAYSCRR